MATRELTDEQRESLVGLMPFSEDARDEFTPDVFKKNVEEELWPVFILRPFTQAEKDKIAEVMEKVVKDPGGLDTKEIHEFTRAGIVGWRVVMNVNTGDDIEFEEDAKGSCSKKAFEKLPVATTNAIMKRENSISGLLGAEALGLSS
jgi:hypothetical protein